jgi:hypothetical protein
MQAIRVTTRVLPHGTAKFNAIIDHCVEGCIEWLNAIALIHSA